MMNVDSVTHDNAIIAKILRNAEWPEGLTFFTSESDYIQVSTWNYNKGKHLKAHSHKEYKRTSSRTQEVVFIKSGRMKVIFYNEDGKKIKEDILNKGDVAIIFSGGHSYDILEDKTEILEFKNGPYLGIENDKRLIEE